MSARIGGDDLRREPDGKLANKAAIKAKLRPRYWALYDMTLRQNDWTLGAICARYCAVVTQHHGVEDATVFPHLARREPQLKPVIERLTEEHLVIHDAIQEVDRALVQHTWTDRRTMMPFRVLSITW